MLDRFTHEGMLKLYAAWNIIGFIVVFLFVPETKALSLEELDHVFSTSLSLHAARQLDALLHHIKVPALYQRTKPPLHLDDHNLLPNEGSGEHTFQNNENA